MFPSERLKSWIVSPDSRATFIKGDPYIRDMKHTACVPICLLRDHPLIEMLLAGMWPSCRRVHGTQRTRTRLLLPRRTRQFGRCCYVLSEPQLKENRIWNVEDKRKQKSVIVVKSKERGARTKINACAYSPDGNMISGGTVHPFLRRIVSHLCSRTSMSRRRAAHMAVEIQLRQAEPHH